ncbi:MAG: acetolactate synthase [Thermomicrobia bacterium]|nr:acetolactate synthase [Thermomicrobia bacterium]MCA1723617.1 acetolactate synthase [Thermomicrobia bacterium]
MCDDCPHCGDGLIGRGSKMTRMSGARAVVEQLKREGVRHAFTVPGESFLSVLDALYDEPAISLVATRHEGGAAFMAEAVGKLTGTPALCMGTRGVGSANMAIALHTADQDSTPLIALIGQVETPHRHKEAFQEVELAPFFAHIVKWAVEVERTDRLPALIHEATRRAIGGRPGPVLLAVPTDVLNAACDFTPDHFFAPAVAPRPAPTASDAAQAVDLLLNAERPAILVGGGVLRACATDDLVRFAEATGIPVIAGFRRYHAFPNNHPLFLGSMGLGSPPCVRERLREADVLLALGTRLSELTTGAYTLPAPETRVIHCDIDASVVGVNNAIALGIVADAQEALTAMQATLTDYPDPKRDARRAATAKDRAVFEAATAIPQSSVLSSQSSVDPTTVMADLARLLPPETIITCDAGNFGGWLGRYHRFALPGAFLGPTSGAMGYAMPAAVGAALARPGVPVLAVAGDGGFLMTGNELETAVRCGLPVIALVFNNCGYGTIRMHQEREFPGRVSATTLGPVDFAMFAQSLGAHGTRVTQRDDFAPALEHALALKRPALIEVVTDPNQIAVGMTIAGLRTED